MTADTLGLTAHDNYELAVRALGACTWYLKESFLDQQLLSMGRFEVYQPQDLVDNAEPALTMVSKPSFSKHMASIGSLIHKHSCRLVDTTECSSHECILISVIFSCAYLVEYREE